MTYSDFVKFITMEQLDLNMKEIPEPAQPAPAKLVEEPVARPVLTQPVSVIPNQPESLSKVLATYKLHICNALLATDPTVTGFCSSWEFESIIQRLSSVNSAEVRLFLGIYDPLGTGRFNYFSLLADICNQVAKEEKARAQLSYESFINRPLDPLPGQESLFLPPAPAPAAPIPAHPAPTRPFAQTHQPHTIPVVPSRADEFVQKISLKMEQVFGSSQSCYQKWRGYSGSLGAQQLMAGANRDFGLDMTVEEAQEIVDRYGSGTLTPGTFQKMLGAGADADAAQRKRQQSYELDDNEKCMMHIARQGKGKRWRDCFDVETPEHIVQGLKKNAVYVLLTDFRPCFLKYGKEGMIEKIQEFMDAL
jgi:hypothetical protein